MQPDILAVGGFTAEMAAAAQPLFAVRRAGPDLADLPAEEAGRIRGVITGATTGISASAMARLPQLEIVAVNGVGYDTVDVDYARAHGIVVTNTPDVLTADVADLAVGLLIALVRDIPRYDRFVRDGRWLAGPPPLVPRRMGDLRVGIFGLGRIGLAIAERLRPMVASIAYHNRHTRNDVAFTYFDTLEALAAAVDALVIAAPGAPGTDGVVNAEVLRALGGGLLVNIARGRLVDQPALVRALTSGGLGGAALDVFVDEPHVPAALMELDHVILQPHIGSGTMPTRRQMGEMVLANLTAHFAGTPVPNEV